MKFGKLTPKLTSNIKAAVWVKEYELFINNEVRNGNFEVWSAGATSAPDGWALEGANAAVGKTDAVKKIGLYCATVTRVGTDCSLKYTFSADQITRLKGKTVSIGCWVWANTANRGMLCLSDGVNPGGLGVTPYHTGDSTWQWLTTTYTIVANPSVLYLYCYVNNGDADVCFDGFIVREASALPATTSTDNFEATSITISGLNGDVDEEYQLVTRFVNNYNGAPSYLLRMNNDTGVNYGQQYMQGGDTTAAAGRSTGVGYLVIGYAAALNDSSLSETIIYAKSGYARTAITKMAEAVAGTTVTFAEARGQVWNNTTDNLTSLVVLADQTDGIGVGSQITLWKKVAR